MFKTRTPAFPTGARHPFPPTDGLRLPSARARRSRAPNHAASSAVRMTRRVAGRKGERKQARLKAGAHGLHLRDGARPEILGCRRLPELRATHPSSISRPRHGVMQGALTARDPHGQRGSRPPRRPYGRVVRVFPERRGRQARRACRPRELQRAEAAAIHQVGGKDGVRGERWLGIRSLCTLRGPHHEAPTWNNPCARL